MFCLHKHFEGTILPVGRTFTHTDYKQVQILLGGDQVSVAHVRGAVGVRSNHENVQHRLEGVIPVIEDWHARQVLADADMLIA